MSFVVAHVVPSLAAEAPVRDRKAFFFGGLAPTQDVDVRAFCPYGVREIDESTTSTDFLLGLVTLGIYTPRTSEYYCLLQASPPSPTP